MDVQAQEDVAATEVLPGIWRFRCGEPEAVTPVTARRHAPAEQAIGGMPTIGQCPVPVRGRSSDRGYLVRIPLGASEEIYGFGLQLQSFVQRGSKKTLRVNADPKLDSGDTHAPVPFYVTTGGYGVLVDTARYATFYCGTNQRDAARSASVAPEGDALPAAYRVKGLGAQSEVLVEVPYADGVDVYVFAGPSMRDAIARSNLFAGGGALPPRWGLGVWYRTFGEFSQDEVLGLAAELRERQMPCDVIGLEPGWQTHAYSCTYSWASSFPNPAGLASDLRDRSFRLNLWEHAFVHPESPLHEPLSEHSGDFRVWGGLVPDFCTEQARDQFARFHADEHVALGVSGYKLDECDNSDYTGGWSFPELSRFPSGIDGEQMHSLFGLRYQDTIQQALATSGERTYGLARSSHALAAPYPYVLYSDLYDHREFVRGLVNSGFSGLLWTPELRDAADPEDLVRRLQTAVLSPMALINAWYIRNPPWKQVDREANNAGDFDPRWEQIEQQCRSLLQLRMQLVPYLQAAFTRYHRDGTPPFRALVVDWPDDRQTWTVDDEYLMGDAFLVAPVFAGQQERDVYLPAGDWYDFWTGDLVPGGRHLTVAADPDTVPLYARGGAVVPLAEPGQHANDPAGARLHVRAYGAHAPGTTVVVADDGRLDSVPTDVVLETDGVGGGIARTEDGRVVPEVEIVSWTRVGA